MIASRLPLTRPAAALLLAASAAFAAPDLTVPPPAGSPGQVPTSSANLSPQETLTQAKDYVAKMQDGMRRIVQLQEMAKKQKDIIKLNCANDKLLQVKGHMAVTDQAMSNLNESIAKGDDDARKHEFTRVTILYQKVLVLGTEAENCIGEDLSYVGATTVTVEIDPSIPVTDVTAFDFPAVDTSRPPVLSAPL